MDSERRNRIAQWAFDTRVILGRFHLWLEDVEERPVRGDAVEEIAFCGDALKRALIMSAAVTALGTRLFGSYARGKGQPKDEINRVKKEADAISAYILSEGLWHLTRSLPENHAVMVSLGEGLMPKAGETPEMGANPMLGFGRVYARPQVARFVDACVRRLINEPGYEWDRFWNEITDEGVTLWGAAIDTLENTSRFAKGADTGPMTVLHLFDQPLDVCRPYEGYMGILTLPRAVVDKAADSSLLIDYRTPRSLVMKAIRDTYPEIAPERVHVWTLGGPSRAHRIESLWRAWRDTGAHLVEDGWTLPNGAKAFLESGTYAPTYLVGDSRDDQHRTNLFIIDGYAGSAEAIQAASLDPVLDLTTSLCIFTSKFKIPWDREPVIMRLDPDAPEFPDRLAAILDEPATSALQDEYGAIIRDARDAGMPLDRPVLRVNDFFPEKRWRVLAISSAMLPDPYTGIPGVRETADGAFTVSTRAATRRGMVDVVLTLRLMKPLDESRLAFSPLLERFAAGADWETHGVKISDSGRIRNELQTLVSQAIEHLGDDSMRVHFDRIEPAVLSPEKQQRIRRVLEWYKRNHPVWFSWLELD